MGGGGKLWDESVTSLSALRGGYQEQSPPTPSLPPPSTTSPTTLPNIGRRRSTSADVDILQWRCRPMSADVIPCAYKMITHRNIGTDADRCVLLLPHMH